MAYDENYIEKPTKADNAKLVERARRCFKLVCDAENKQRQREKEDVLFQIPENQWSDAARAERNGDGITSPKRPMVSINLLQQPKALVEGQFAKAHIGVNLRPVGEKSSKELAEAVQDLYRRIERDGKAGQARGWGFKRAIEAGRGWYRINTQYDEDSDPNGPGAWDQEITFERILYQENVYPDPASAKPDFSDAKWFLYVAWKDEQDFKREFPDATGVGDDMEWANPQDSQPEWARHENGERSYLVAEYWWKDIDAETIEAPDGRKRDREKVTVYHCKVSGSEVLEGPQEWNGHHIPFIFVPGRELVPIDGQRIWEGMTRPARGAQQGYNYSISTALEDMGRLSKAPYVGPVGSFETDKAKWDTLNVRSYPYVEADIVTVDGQHAEMPHPMQIDGTKLQISLAMAEQFKGAVQATTAVYAPSLGEMPVKREAQSGRAIQALQSQSDAGTSIYMDSMERVALPYEAIVVLDLIPAIYDRPGRITQILGGEDDTRAVMLNAPFVTGPDGQPQPAPPGARQAKTYNLRDARFQVAVDIGKSYQTRLEAGNAFTAGIVEADPQQLLIMGDLFYQFQDAPGSPEMSERYKRIIQQTHPGLIDDGDGQESIEAVKAKAAALEAQLQQMGQQMQQMGQALETKQAEQQAKVTIAQGEQQAKVSIAQLDAQKETTIAQMNNAAKVLVARITSANDTENLVLEAQEEERALGIQLQHDAEMQQDQHVHEAAMAASAAATAPEDETNEGEDTE